MPQPRHTSQAFDGYVTLSQLVSSPPVMADYDMIDQTRLDPEFKDALVGPPASMGGKTPPQPYGSIPSWNAPSLLEMPMTTSPYHSSSPSTSPSPKDGYISVNAEQHSKRRAQNRAAQRAYRDRKVRHLVDLESGIREIEDKIHRLQSENTELIRELCEIRAENREWQRKRSRHDTSLHQGASNHHHPQGETSKETPPPPPQKRPPPPFKPPTVPTGDDPEEVDTLYGPFTAMWNLIRLDPSVVRGNVTAGTVLERLRSMVEEEFVMERRKSSLTSIAESEEGVNEVS